MNRVILASPGFQGRAIGATGGRVVGDAPTFPLMVDSSGRFLTSSAGAPFLIWADSAWSMFAQPTMAEVKQYLDDRVARGFNACLANLIEHEFTTHSPAWRNANGVLPFDASNNFDQPTAAYFDHCVAVLAEAAARGVVVFVVPSYLGFVSTDEGWYDVMQAQTTGQMRTYGQYVGTRLRGSNNVIYMMGGDRDPASKTRTQEVAAGIRDVDTSKVFTAHCAPGTVPHVFWSGETWMAAGVSLANAYTKSADDIPYPEGVTEYNRSPTRPWLNIEDRYEGGPSHDQATPLQIRHQAWWNVLSGACGHFYGQNEVWQFASGWQSSLNTTGVRHNTIASSTLRARDWWRLVPDFSSTMVTAGRGTNGSADYVTAARAADGSFGLAYLPTSRQVTIAMGQFSGTVDARWMDPTNQSYTVIGLNLANSGSSNFTPPGGDNAGGDDDWVLILDANT
jgi:hypothetical protein